MRSDTELGRGMDPERYRALVRAVSLPSSAVPHVRLLAGAHDVAEDTVRSVYAQEVQAGVKRHHASLTAAAEALAARWAATWVAEEEQGAGEEAVAKATAETVATAGEKSTACSAAPPSQQSPMELDLVQAAYALDAPPCALARRLLEALDLGLGRSGATAALREPARLPELARGTCGVPPALLTALAHQLAACVDVDGSCSPGADEARRLAGGAAESALESGLAACGVAFWAEPALRARGFFKTPDACLAVPVAVGGRVVHWIDSKATFGDGRMHASLLAEQYELYVHRFGPGMVIYWHGFVDDIDRHPGVLVTDGFPPAAAMTQLPRLRVTDVQDEDSKAAVTLRQVCDEHGGPQACVSLAQLRDGEVAC